MKTLRVTGSQVHSIREKFSMIESKNWTLDLQVTPGVGQTPDWISIRLKVNETGKYHTLCAGDYDWIVTPGKLEMHIFGVGRDMGEEHILEHYNCTKK